MQRLMGDWYTRVGLGTGKRREKEAQSGLCVIIRGTKVQNKTQGVVRTLHYTNYFDLYPKNSRKTMTCALNRSLWGRAENRMECV